MPAVDCATRNACATNESPAVPSVIPTGYTRFDATDEWTYAARRLRYMSQPVDNEEFLVKLRSR